jgi:hypothetical protein
MAKIGKGRRLEGRTHGGEFCVRLPDATFTDVGLHEEILAGALPLPDRVAALSRERLLRAGFTEEEIETRFDRG